jgi:HEAT repeat protein
VRLVRACGQVKGEQVLALMKPYLNHRASDVRSQVMATLHACRYQAGSGELPAVNAVLRQEVEQAHRLLVALQDIGGEEAVQSLGRALGDELVRARRRIFWLLSFIYESRPLLRAEAELSHGSKSGQAVALEMLDVTLSPGHKLLTFPIIDPKIGRDQRVQLLNRQFQTNSLGRDERLLDLIAQRSHGDIQNADEGWARPWTRACAIYAAAKLGLSEAVPSVEAASADRDPVVQETALWAYSFLQQDSG